jgi:2-haloacid dehalogenase/putative hydrolase of the HAD superfamily
MAKFKNIVFDLGGVVVARDPRKVSAEFQEFFSFIYQIPMPHFWEEYDRGTSPLEEVKNYICEHNDCSRELCDEYIATAIGLQEEIAPTKSLIEQLKKAGYRLYVLSNMSPEFIDFIRRLPVYANFDGEVVSCEEKIVKPEPEIFRLLLNRYSLDASECLFIDDRVDNIEASEREDICGFHFDRKNPQASCELLKAMLL